MKIFLPVSLLLMSLLSAAQPGTLRTNFGVNGITSFKNSFLDYHQIRFFESTPLGLLYGGTYGAGILGAESYIGRLGNDGKPDVQFGNDGIVILPYEFFALNFLVGNDGIIYIQGFVRYNFELTKHTVILAMNQDGSIHEAFGENGLVKLNLINYQGNKCFMKMDASGKLIVVGEHLLNYDDEGVGITRLNQDGSFDTQFNTTGDLLVRPGYDMRPKDLQVFPDGSLLIHTTTFSEDQLVKISATGMLDASFSNDGILENVSRYIGYISAEADGRIYIAGFEPQVRLFFTYLNTDGTEYGTSYIPYTDLYSYTQIVVHRDLFGNFWYGYNKNSTVVIGYEPTFLKITSSLVLDDSFGSGGILSMAPTTNTALKEFQIEPSGNLLTNHQLYVDSGSYDYFVRLTPDGLFDTSFDSSAVLHRTWGSNELLAYRSIADAQGRILTTSDNERKYPNGTSYREIIVNRFTSNGSLDPLFGQNGKVVLDAESRIYPTRTPIALDANGKIICGTSQFSPEGYSYVVIRLNEDGSPDNSFDNDGKLVIPGTNSEGLLTMLAVDPDGKILITNTGHNNDAKLTRLNADGTLDLTFNGTGWADIPEYVDIVKKIIVSPSGKIILAAESYTPNTKNTNFMLMKLNSDGTWDMDFGAVAILDVSNHDEIEDIICAENESILFCGSVASKRDFTGAQDMIVGKITAAGIPDPDFHSTGYLILPKEGGHEKAYRVYRDDNGKILLTGYVQDSITNTRDFYAVRLNASGEYDPGFGTAGIFRQPEGMGYSSLLTSDLDIIMTGQHDKNLVLMKIDNSGFVSNTKRTTENDLQFSVYPNPSSGKFSIRDIPAGSTIEVFDAVGNLVLQDNSSLVQYELDLVGAEKGLYLLSIHQDGKKTAKKIVVE